MVNDGPASQCRAFPSVARYRAISMRDTAAIGYLIVTVDKLKNVGGIKKSLIWTDTKFVVFYLASCTFGLRKIYDRVTLIV